MEIENSWDWQEEKRIEKLRILIGEKPNSKRREDASVLHTYLEMAGDAILERMYPFVDWKGKEYTVPAKYESIQMKIATYLLNKRGAEGQVQHIENGIHRNYGDADIPESMLAGIAPFIGVPK